MDRRKLISWFGLGWLVSLVPSSLTGCTDAATTPKASVAPSAAESVAAAPKGTYQAIGTVAQLDQGGTLVSSNKKIAVVRDPKDKNKILAVNTACTHNGCAVAWKSDKKQYVCPCHDAEFAADGAVLAGPAKKPLQTYLAKIEKGQVLVSA